MALFAGRDRTGTNVDWKGQGSSSAFIMAVAVVTAIPTALGHSSGTASTTATALGSVSGITIPSGATHVRIDVASGGGSLVYTIDGATTPTATLGEVIPAGEAGEIALADLTQVKLRADTGTAAFSASFRRYDVAS